MSKSYSIKITSKGQGFRAAIRELWQNPDLLWAFTYRDLKIRYAQTALGYLWSVIQPLFGLLAVFIVFFRLAGLDSGEIPYLLFALSGLVFWNYFNYVLTQSAASIIHMQAMVKKIYFPRLSIPISKAIVGSVDLLVALLILAIVMQIYRFPIYAVGSFPLILILTAMAALGGGMIVSALSIRFRDLQQILPFLTQILFFITPVAYPSDLLQKAVGSDWLWVAYLNPMVGILELFRLFLFGQPLSQWASLSMVVSVLLFLVGIWLFIRTDKKMADLI